MRAKLVGILALLAALMLAGAACGSGEDTAPERESFTSTEGGFSADFPGEPEEATQSASEAGLDLTVHFFTHETDDYAVSVGYVDYPVELSSVDPKQVLSGVAQGAAGNVGGGEVTRNDPGTFLGLDAVDYEVKADGAELQAKAFLKDNRMYILQAVSETLSDSDAAYDRMVESFKLL